MKFRTEYVTRAAAKLLDPGKPIVLIGSCFTDYIGERMRDCRWRAYPNLTGTLFNPASIAKILRLTLEPDREERVNAIVNSIRRKNDLWTTWLGSSIFTTYSRPETYNRLTEAVDDLTQRLEEAETLIVTFGTAWIYELNELPGYVVANCHKYPSDTFVRRRLGVSEIVGEWDELLKELKDRYPGLKVIFTISPVRHLKDGFEGNSLSKAVLRLACEEICRRNPDADYFPAYEIVNDDLRDYRFYASDLVHPSDEAVEYIWEKFQDRYLSPASRALLAEGLKVTKRLNHRPLLLDDSEQAHEIAVLQRREAEAIYKAFIEANPNML